MAFLQWCTGACWAPQSCPGIIAELDQNVELASGIVPELAAAGIVIPPSLLLTAPCSPILASPAPFLCSCSTCIQREVFPRTLTELSVLLAGISKVGAN